ncbi:MAG: hypothetical protein ABI409_15360 [Ramlibacter sp.]
MSMPRKPQAKDEKQREQPPDQEPGSNAVEHEPDPDAKPIADGEHRYVPRSPYTTGNY